MHVNTNIYFVFGIVLHTVYLAFDMSLSQRIECRVNVKLFIISIGMNNNNKNINYLLFPILFRSVRDSYLSLNSEYVHIIYMLCYRDLFGSMPFAFCKKDENKNDANKTVISFIFRRHK